MNRWYILPSGIHACTKECADAADHYSLRKTSNTVSTAISTAGAIATSSVYAENIILSAARGHGFAAERANHFVDVMAGKDAIHKGGDNLKHGADRIVNGVDVQSKYCRTGSKCIGECFENGKMIYTTNGGANPMAIEVPYDLYDDSIKAMRSRIERGQVPGVSDPNKAGDIVRRGHFTYKQAVNMAKFGTVESLAYDTINGVKVAGLCATISAIIMFARAKWDGKSTDESLSIAGHTMLRVGVVTISSSIVSSQLAKSGIHRLLSPFTRDVASGLSREAVEGIVSASGVKNAAKLSVDSLRGAAERELSGNVVTGVVTVVFLSSLDISDLVRGNISGSQAFKNVTVTTATVAGGMGGWTGGAIVGAMIGNVVPIVGSVVGATVGGFVGSMVGGSASNYAAKKTMDQFVEDDAKRMLKIFEAETSVICEGFLLSRGEIEELTRQIALHDMALRLQEMYRAGSHERYAAAVVRPIAITISQCRSVVPPLTKAHVDRAIESVMEAAE